WDGSDITLKAKCLPNGRVRLGLYNSGTGAMQDSSAYRLYLDAKLVLNRNYKLAPGDSLVLQIPANGQTLRLEADQRPGHPTKSATNVTLEACGTNAGGTVSLGFVAQLPQDDAEPEVDTECLPITDSFDPNDKLVLPAGVTAAHYTAFGQELEYTVRFQNTGNDYAYRVVVVDTLSEKLDVSTLRVAGASHPYRFSLSGKGRPVLTFTFEDINLPDSTRDQQGSNGLVKFTIKPLKDLPEKTRIENYADIFFDYNPPVRTDTTLNTLYDLPLETTSSDAPPLTVCTPNLPVSAGADQAFCEAQTTVLQAQNPVHGQGRWKRISGAGRIEQLHDPHTAVEGLGYGANVFEWSIADGTCANDSLRARVTVTRHRSPAVPTIAYLGVNDLQSSVEGETYQWYCNGLPLADNGRTLKGIRGGMYTVRVSAGGCFSALSAPFDFRLTSPVLALLATVYPNPAEREFTVDLPGGVGRVTLSLFDPQGRRVAEISGGNPGGEPLRRTFQLPGCRAGVYLLKIQTADALVVKRVVLR
ncbi:MAG TPA: T9SS type A sorting domain-containing protein, partial [Cytophagales bacterium]